MTPRLLLRARASHRFAFALGTFFSGCAVPASSEVIRSHAASGDGDRDLGQEEEQTDTPDDESDDAADPGESPQEDSGAWAGWGQPDGSLPSGDAQVGGWTPTSDGGVSPPDPDPAGDAGSPPGDCRPLARNTNSGAFGTTGAVCFTVQEQPATAWEAYFVDGRTITINGTVVSKGQMPFPGSPPFMVEFSAGTYDYASWAYW